MCHDVIEHGREYPFGFGQKSGGCPVLVQHFYKALVEKMPADENTQYHKRSKLQRRVIRCINKFDINEENSRRIESICDDLEITVVSKLPYDNVFTEALTLGQSVVEYTNGEISNRIKSMWQSVVDEMPD